MTVPESSKPLFAGLPRRRRLGAAIAVGTWLVIGIAFLADVASAPRGAEWLYRMEARRAEYARALAAEQASAAAQAAGEAEPAAPARRARRAPPTAQPLAAHAGGDARATPALVSSGLCSILAAPAADPR